MSPEDLEKVARRIMIERFLPVLVRNLIIAGILDTNRFLEEDYIVLALVSAIDAHPEFVDDLQLIVSIDDNFLESARDAIEMNRPEVAVVLIATFIEHQLNMFYREALSEHDSLDNDAVTKIIRSNSLSDKTGWLFRLVLQDEMNDDLQREILNLAELRNQIVH